MAHASTRCDLPRRSETVPQGSWVIHVLAMMAGASVGLMLQSVLWSTSNPGLGFDDAAKHAQTAWQRGDGAALLAATVGGFVGFLAAGFALKNMRVRTVTRTSWTVAVLASGSLVGAAMGVIAYMVFWLASYPNREAARIFLEVPEAFATGNGPLIALVMSGGLVGFSVTAYLLGNEVVQRLSRAVVGLLLGGLAGLAIHGVAYVMVNYPRVPDSPYYFLYLGEALYSFSALEFFFVGFGAFLGLLMARYSWRFYGVMTLISLVFVVVGFLGYSLFVTMPKVEAAYKPFAILLFCAETVSLTMVVLYSFYTIDVATRKHWRKSPKEVPYSKYYVPKVCVQVPCFNEPPELVIATLERLALLEYPTDRFLVMVIDDSTDDRSAKPLAAFCAENQITYLRRKDRRGYKAGALNYSMQFVPEDVDFFAVIDADYQVTPEYLKETVGYFINPNTAWLQTPQDYRNRHQSFLTEQYYVADAYFYRTVMPSRNEENTIIFCGTMGILRRQALVDVGGWGEEYISEDAELSVRLLVNGYDSLYVNKTYGRGLIPPTFEGYRKQHYRWAFGGAKILRGHFWDILFGRMSRRQSFDYFVGSAHWFEGLFIILISWILVLLTLGELLSFPVVTHHSQEILLIGLIPMFLLTDGITRLHMVMRDSMKLGLGQTIHVLGMWFAVKFSNSFGAAKSMLGWTLPFVRTPKAPSDRMAKLAAFKRAARVARFETTMAAILLGLMFLVVFRVWSIANQEGQVALTRTFLAFWLLYYALVFASAPWYAYKSYTTFVPDEELGIALTTPPHLLEAIGGPPAQARMADGSVPRLSERL
jgi:cellulose synthase/poly-beta-1,6-N-acetylglucosamine synthase-like glycosyltransferase